MSIYIKSVNISGEIPEGEYISSLNAVKNLKKMGSLPFKKSVTFFVGENGIGKSTLIEAIAINAGFNPEGGSRDFNFSTVCANSRLYDYISLDKGTLRAVDGFFLRAESFFNVASNIDTLNSEKAGLLDS